MKAIKLASLLLTAGTLSFSILPSLVNTPAKGFVIKTANINANSHAMTPSTPETILAVPCRECEGPRDRDPSPQPTPKSTPNRDYPATVRDLLNNSTLNKIINTMWIQGGKGIVAQQIKDKINGRTFSDDVGAYDANVNLGAIADNQVTAGPGPNQFSVKLVIPGNNVEFKTTTPTFFGSYADPSFRVGFDLTVNLTMSVEQSNSPIKVNEVTVQSSNANIHGSNAVGTIVETLGDLFTNGGFSRDITSGINQNYNAKDQLAKYIQLAIDRV